MAEMRPPPPRYRIIEHKGRLIATDTWAENRPARSDAPTAPITPMPGTPKPSQRSMPGAAHGTGNGGSINAFAAVLVLLVCAGSTDDTGRPILTTANFYDVEGPRQIVLGRVGAKRLGRWLIAMVAAMVAIALLIYATPWGFIIAFVVVGMVASNANTAARPVITRWLDRLEQAG